MKVAVVRFPGSNCDLDALAAIGRVDGLLPELVWHHESQRLLTFDAAVLPGGFSFGDYLRAGSIAARSPAVSAIRKMADRGDPVLGICNGFQILVEAGLLPGALLRNAGLKFVCRWTDIKVMNSATPFTRSTRRGQVLKMPIAHGEGRYFASDEELAVLGRERRVIFRYCDDGGRVTAEANPTGTAENIAGISNREGNVVGMMPHPERASEPLPPLRRGSAAPSAPSADDGRSGTSDGRLIFASLLGGAE